MTVVCFRLHVIRVFNYLALGKGRKMNVKFGFELQVITLYLLLLSYLQG